MTSTNALLQSDSYNDEVFYRKRKALATYPVIALPFAAAMFWVLGGGRSFSHPDNEIAGRQRSGGFNASVPVAKNSQYANRSLDKPAYGRAAGQVLSEFTRTRRDSAMNGLKAIAVKAESTTATEGVATVAPAVLTTTTPSNRRRENSLAATKRTQTAKPKGSKSVGNGYYYRAPGYASTGLTDQQLESQLQTYENTRRQPAPSVNTVSNALGSATPTEQQKAANVRMSDNVAVTRLNESSEEESPFVTAMTGGTRPEPTRAVLSSGNNSGRKTIAWMIPVVVHQDQQVRDGETVKLRLLKEVTADGVTIPANTILHALCQISQDRLKLTVRSLQLNGQFIPLDLDVYDTDGAQGVNVPGLSQRMDGQVRSQAIQGVQLPGAGGLVNGVANAVRMGVSNNVRHTTIRLRSGYNLFLKAQ